MRTIEIPEAVYEEAARRARGQSVDAFVADVLNAFLDEAPLVLTPEQLERIAEAEADIDAGRVFTPEQVRAHFAQRRAERIGHVA